MTSSFLMRNYLPIIILSCGSFFSSLFLPLCDVEKSPEEHVQRVRLHVGAHVRDTTTHAETQPVRLWVSCMRPSVQGQFCPVRSSGMHHMWHWWADFLYGGPHVILECAFWGPKIQFLWFSTVSSSCCQMMQSDGTNTVSYTHLTLPTKRIV